MEFLDGDSSIRALVYCGFGQMAKIGEQWTELTDGEKNANDKGDR